MKNILEKNWSIPLLLMVMLILAALLPEARTDPALQGGPISFEEGGHLGTTALVSRSDVSPWGIEPR